MAGIALSGVTKSYGGQSVINGVDLDIHDGEFLTLVGPSGCGKSTTLRIIAGLETQSSGDVSIDGVSVNETRPSLRDLAMVFQSYALYPHLTVRQNLMTPLRLRDLSFWERFPLLGHLLPSRRSKMVQIEKEVQIVSETLKIEPLLARKPGQLSGGQRQRVALGRAMVRNPAAFLMDEPLSNLDASLRVHMRAELSALHKKLKTTFIYVTHDQAEALTMSDRIAVMMDGDLLQLGSPEEVYQNPQDIRVAEFIGSPKMNILPGHCDEFGHITCAGLSLGGVLADPAPGPVSVGLRPEHLTLTDAEAAQSLSGKLTYKENLGSDVFFHVTQEGSESAIIIRAQPLAATPQKPGDTLHCAPVPGKPLVFGADGRRLDFNHVASSGKLA
ncbi:ABC transporter ATP-binding protein [Paracoccaceae bacterium]|nr:ABC transporter ATP-binding protein [Paracoccaceae bacterium]